MHQQLKLMPIALSASCVGLLSTDAYTESVSVLDCDGLPSRWTETNVNI